jgi:hypothetical protein
MRRWQRPLNLKVAIHPPKSKYASGVDRGISGDVRAIVLHPARKHAQNWKSRKHAVYAACLRNNRTPLGSTRKLASPDTARQNPKAMNRHVVILVVSNVAIPLTSTEQRVGLAKQGGLQRIRTLI